jgi:hypothetical protein
MLVMKEIDRNLSATSGVENTAEQALHINKHQGPRTEVEVG